MMNKKLLGTLALAMGAICLLLAIIGTIWMAVHGMGIGLTNDTRKVVSAMHKVQERAAVAGEEFDFSDVKIDERAMINALQHVDSLQKLMALMSTGNRLCMTCGANCILLYILGAAGVGFGVWTRIGGKQRSAQYASQQGGM